MDKTPTHPTHLTEYHPDFLELGTKQSELKRRIEMHEYGLRKIR